MNKIKELLSKLKQKALELLGKLKDFLNKETEVPEQVELPPDLALNHFGGLKITNLVDPTNAQDAVKRSCCHTTDEFGSLDGILSDPLDATTVENCSLFHQENDSSPSIVMFPYFKNKSVKKKSSKKKQNKKKSKKSTKKKK